jgi:rhomboid protease GluP
MTIDHAGEPESFAFYLAKALIAKKGFWAGGAPELRPLFEHCDAIVTRSDGLTFQIVAIVDRETTPAREFNAPKELLESIGKECLRYTGRTFATKLPVFIDIIEAGAAPITQETMARLKRLKRRNPFSKVVISATALDVASGKLWTNTPLRRFGLRPFIEKLMARPRMEEADLAPQTHAAMADKRPLLLTYAILTALAAAFACEFIFQIEPPSEALTPTIKTLIALGALDRSLVAEAGEWWRVFSAPMLHANALHILLNGVALFFAGAILENVIGRVWFAGVYAVSGVCGALMSLAMNPAGLVSVGASGAIMGLFAAAFSVSFRYPNASPMRSYLQSGSLRVLIPSMIPLAGGIFGGQIDIAAHAGGAIGGAAMGAALVWSWPQDAVLPPYRKLAAVVGLAGLCGAVFSGAEVARNYEPYTLSAYVIPDNRLPKSLDALKEQSASLVQSYPRDPRSRMYHAMTLQGQDDMAGAESEWRAALSEDKMLKLFFKPELENLIRGNLAAVLDDNGKEAEAKEVAKPLCAGQGEVHDAVVKQGLCP